MENLNQHTAHSIDSRLERLNLRIGLKIADLLEKKELSKKEFGQLIGKQTPNVYQLLGKNNQIELLELIRLSLALEHNLVLDVALDVQKLIEESCLEHIQGDKTHQMNPERMDLLKEYFAIKGKELETLHDELKESIHKKQPVERSNMTGDPTQTYNYQKFGSKKNWLTNPEITFGSGQEEAAFDKMFPALNKWIDHKKKAR